MELRLKGHLTNFTGFIIEEPAIFFINGEEECYWDSTELGSYHEGSNG